MSTNQVTDPITEAEEPPRHFISREQVLTRLWEIATMSPEMTRNSASAQVKAISIIVAIEGLIPDRKQKPCASPSTVNVFSAAKYNEHLNEAAGHANPDPVPDKKESAIPDPPPASAADTSLDAEPAPSLAFSESHPAHSLTPPRTNPWVPEASAYASIPDQSLPLSVPKNRFGRRR